MTQSTTFSLTDRDPATEEIPTDVSEIAKLGPIKCTMTRVQVKCLHPGSFFNPDWATELPFLEYSESKNTIYCFSCRLFDPDSVYAIGKDAAQRCAPVFFRRHRDSKVHKKSVSQLRLVMKKRENRGESATSAVGHDSDRDPATEIIPGGSIQDDSSPELSPEEEQPPLKKQTQTSAQRKKIFVERISPLRSQNSSDNRQRVQVDMKYDDREELYGHHRPQVVVQRPVKILRQRPILNPFDSAAHLMEHDRDRIAPSEKKLKGAYEEIRQILAADERERINKRDISETAKTLNELEADVIELNQENAELRSQNDRMDEILQELETVREERDKFAKKIRDFQVTRRDIRVELNENLQKDLDETIAPPNITPKSSITHVSRFLKRKKALIKRGRIQKRNERYRSKQLSRMVTSSIAGSIQMSTRTMNSIANDIVSELKQIVAGMSDQKAEEPNVIDDDMLKRQKKTLEESDISRIVELMEIKQG